MVETKEGGGELVSGVLLRQSARANFSNEFGKLEPAVNRDFGGSNSVNCSLTKVERGFTWNW